MARLLHEDVAEDVAAHAEGFGARLLAVVVHVLVLPAVAEVALPAEEAHQPPLIHQPVSLGRRVVVLVYLRQAVGEVVLLMVYGVREWQLDKLQLGKHLLHLRHYVVAQTIVVVNMEEPVSMKDYLV